MPSFRSDSPRHDVGDTVWLVRSLEHDGQPLLGEYYGTVEDSVRYLDAGDVLRYAPEDCVRVEPFVCTSKPEDDGA